MNTIRHDRTNMAIKQYNRINRENIMTDPNEPMYKNYSLYKFNLYIVGESFFKISLLWFTLFDYGVLVKNIKYHPLLFSERGNFYYQYQIKNWYFRILGLRKN